MTLRYLSPEWFAAANELLTALPAPEQPTIVGYSVTDGDDKVIWTLTADDTGLRLCPGESAPFCLAMDYPTAAAISAGSQSAQRAFLAGAIELIGDRTQIPAAAAAIGSADGALTSLRERTTYDSESDLG